MKLFIKVLRGDGCIVDIDENATVLDVKRQIQNELKVPVSQQTLILVGKTLADDKRLSSYPGIKDGVKLNLIIKKSEPLDVVLLKFLKQYYTPEQSDRILKEFMKDFHSKIETLSLDDLERIAISYLND